VPIGNRQRKLLFSAGLTLAGLAICWFSLPLWFPWVLRPAARKAGLVYSRYEREGYSRFVLHNISYTDRSARVRAERLTALVPSAWLWGRVTGARSSATLSAQGWSFESLPSNQPDESVYSQKHKLDRDVRFLEHWVSLASLSNGTLRLPQLALEVPAATWRTGTLSAELILPWRGAKAMLEGKRGPAGAGYEVRLSSSAIEFHSTILLVTNPAGLALQSTNFWWSNRVELTAQFATTGQLPERAALTARNFRLPAQALGVREFDEVQGSLSGEWQNGTFSLDLIARGTPLASAADLPTLQLDLHARGDTNAATIERATAVSPWLKLDLSRHLNVYFKGPALRQPAVLRAAVDLTRQPWYPLEGTLNGEANFTPAPGKFPAAEFHLAGSEVGRPSLRAKAVAIDGRFQWPWIELSQARVNFDDGSTASVKGRLQVEKREIAQGEFHYDGPLARRWLPKQLGFSGLSASAGFDGPLRSLAHRGYLEATNFTAGHFSANQVRAEWSGVERNLPETQVVFSAGESSLSVRAALSAAADKFELQLKSLTLETNRQPALELVRPCRILAGRADPTAAFQVSVSEFQWLGSGGRIFGDAGLNWPAEGAARLRVQEFSPSLLFAFTTNRLPEIQIHQLDTAANWTNGPMRFTLDLAASGLLPAPRPLPRGETVAGAGTAGAAPGLTSAPTPVRISASMAGDQDGVVLTNFNLTSQTSAVAVAYGTLPLRIHPANSTVIRLDEQRPLTLHASTKPDAFFWNDLAELTGLLMIDPSFQLDISGNWQKPEGHMKLSAESVRLTTAKQALPAFEKLQLTVLLDRQRARMADGRVLVQGQPVYVSGQLPLEEDFWAALRQGKLPSWEKASGRVQVEDASLAAFQPLFPKVLAPQGELTVDFRLLPGGKFDGELLVQHARTRPLGDTGPIRDINLRLRFVDRTLKLVSATAHIGASTVTFSGQADLRPAHWRKSELPPFGLSLHGSDIPLAREPDFIIRSDLLLAVTKTNGAPPLISGAARLRDSYYLSELRPLVPGKVTTPAKRPPYFSVEDTVFSEWRLAVDVSGTRFLKVRSPVFTGEVSANLQVQGTLKDPIALGDVKIDSGLVRFPFASLQVQQGMVNLSSQDPYRPQITVSASSKQFGYDIRLEVSGGVDAPLIQFSSTPPLSSEQILLMVTAGELPQGSYTLTPQQRAQTVALFLGRDLLARLGFGDQAQQRLTVHSGEQIAPQGRPTYSLEYKLSDRWSLEGEYDRFGDFNAGFKWRIFSK
jgi:translocation and assembly module TamB